MLQDTFIWNCLFRLFHLYLGYVKMTYVTVCDDFAMSLALKKYCRFNVFDFRQKLGKKLDVIMLDTEH